MVVYACQKIRRPKELGSVQIPILELSDGQIHEGWHTIVALKKGKQQPVGELHLKLQYSSEVERNKDYMLAKRNSATLMQVILHHDLVCVACLCKVYESEELSKV